MVEDLGIYPKLQPLGLLHPLGLSRVFGSAARSGCRGLSSVVLEDDDDDNDVDDDGND